MEDNTSQPSPSTLRFYVKTISGEKFALTVDPEITVDQLKNEIEKLCGIAKSKQRLIFQGRALNDHHTVGKDCKIQEDNVVHLVEKSVPVADPAGATTSSTTENTSSNRFPSSSHDQPQISPQNFPTIPFQGANVVIRAVQLGLPTFGNDPNQQTQEQAQQASNNGPSPQSNSNAANTNAPVATATLATVSNPIVVSIGPNGVSSPSFLPQQLIDQLQQQASIIQAQLQQPQSSSNTQATSTQNPEQQQQQQQQQQQHHHHHHHHQHQQHQQSITICINLISSLEMMIQQVEQQAEASLHSSHIPSTSTQPSSENQDNSVPSLYRRTLRLMKKIGELSDLIEGSRSNENQENATENRAHPYRHHFEHAIPRILQQLSHVLSMLSPLLLHHHTITHHSQPETSNSANRTNPQPSATASQQTEGSQQRQSNTATNSTSENSRPTQPPQIQLNSLLNSLLGGVPQPAGANSSQTAAPSPFAQLFNSIAGMLQPLAQQNPAQSNTSPSTQSTTAAQSNTAPSAQPNPASTSTQTTTPPAQSNAAPSSDNSTLTIPAPSSSQPTSSTQLSEPMDVVTEISSASAVFELSDDQFMERWEDIIAHDMEVQSHLNPQAPFSDAYAGGFSQPAGSNKEDSPAGLLTSLLSEAAASANQGNDDAMDIEHMPSDLIDMFCDQLRGSIRERLEVDSDWNEIQRRQKGNKYPNLTQLQKK